MPGERFHIAALTVSLALAACAPRTHPVATVAEAVARVRAQLKSSPAPLTAERKGDVWIVRTAPTATRAIQVAVDARSGKLVGFWEQVSVSAVVNPVR